MPTLHYTGTRSVDAENASKTVPELAGEFVTISNSDSDVEFREASMSPGRNGSMDLTISLEVSGSYGELSTVEETLAKQVVAAGFEPDTTTAKETLSLD